VVITGTMVLSARCADIDSTQLRGRKNSFPPPPLFVDFPFVCYTPLRLRALLACVVPLRCWQLGPEPA